jgi:membrane protein
VAVLPRPGALAAALSARRVIRLLRAVGEEYGRHAGSELAAAIAYRILFSLVPFIALLAAVIDAVMPDTARQDVVDWIVGAFPGGTVQEGVQHQLDSSIALTSLAGLVAFGALIWTASGMTRSLRIALGVVWETEVRPEFVQAKLRDIAALGVLAALVVASFCLSLASQIAIQAGVSVVDALGLGFAATTLTRALELLVTGTATFAALLVVYRLGAPVRIPLAAIWPGALVTALAIDVGVAGYAFYLVRIASFDTIYGPLGAALAFLALVYIAAQLVLLGAELIRHTGDARDLSGRQS